MPIRPMDKPWTTWGATIDNPLPPAEKSGPFTALDPRLWTTAQLSKAVHKDTNSHLPLPTPSFFDLLFSIAPHHQHQDLPILN